MSAAAVLWALLSIVMLRPNSATPQSYTRNSVFYAGTSSSVLPTQASAEVLKDLGVDLPNDGKKVVFLFCLEQI